jgi:threonine-phosphate decarboxylase
MYKYVHGGDVYSQIGNFIDFSANVNSLGTPKGVKNAIRAAAGNCSKYPDPFCRELTAKLAMHWHVDSTNILAGNGAADLLFKLALALHPKHTLLLAPTFADYEKAFTTVNSKFSYYNLVPEYDFAVQQDILNKIVPGIDLIVICNPNNPTGQLTDEKLLLDILKKAQAVGATLLIDECFMEFVSPPDAYSMKSYLKKYKNLVILRAFTKTFAMAGVRLGYLMTTNTALIDACRVNSQDWSVSTLAQAAGIAALNEEHYLRITPIYVQEERVKLMAALHKLGIKTFASRANYIFMYVPQITKFVDKLKVKGFLVRPCENYVNLNENYVRIAVRTKIQNKKLIKAIKEIIANEVTANNY